MLAPVQARADPPHQHPRDQRTEGIVRLATPSRGCWRPALPGTAPAESGRHAVALPGPEGGGLVANVLPLSWRDGRNPPAALRGGSAVIVRDPAVPSATPLQAFAALYGPTATEARALDHLARGRTLQDAADVLGVGLTTVKTHLQKLFAKTGTSRQTELYSWWPGRRRRCAPAGAAPENGRFSNERFTLA